MQKKKLIIVVGPTASGKSDLTFQIAKDLSYQIVVCDAFQVYQEISRGINKPDAKALKEIRHHFVNHISIFEAWNIKRFKNEFDTLMQNNLNTKFILEGGSNLYIDCLINNYNIKAIDSNLSFDHLSNEELYSKLYELDSVEALKIGNNNRKRLLQALKIIYSNNFLKKSELDKKNLEPLYDFFIIKKEVEREKLYQKINLRAQKMFDNNWRQEVVQLIEKHGDKITNLNAFKAIGYDEIYHSIIEKRETNLELIKQKTRQYAKRQETWINNKFKIDFKFKSYNQYQQLLAAIYNFWNDK
ncbi:MAG: tRNA (adenosine(37)-N6)-dimethylallyltransferase MiaA [Malacoplasma sp.]|nr:tRNA (adenosine(37)-N6)-dimethylallyltransferase MiaA [Malacoplasma sp.]